MKRYPQYILMLDLLLLFIFVLISNLRSEEIQIEYFIKGNTLPDECYLFNEGKENYASYHYNRDKKEWILSNNIIDPDKSLFIEFNNEEYMKKFLEIDPPLSGKLLLMITGKLALRIKSIIYDNKIKNKNLYNRFKIYIDEQGNIEFIRNNR